MEFNATFFVSVISFIVFTFLMNKIFYAPISKVVSERQKMIDEILEDVANSKNETTKYIEERENQLIQSTEESRKIIADKVDKANKRANVLTTNAKNASFEDIAFKKEQLLKDEESVREKLNEVTKALSDDIVSRVLG